MFKPGTTTSNFFDSRVWGLLLVCFLGAFYWIASSTPVSEISLLDLGVRTGGIFFLCLCVALGAIATDPQRKKDSDTISRLMIELAELKGELPRTDAITRNPYVEYEGVIFDFSTTPWRKFVDGKWVGAVGGRGSLAGALTYGTVLTFDEFKRLTK